MWRPPLLLAPLLYLAGADSPYPSPDDIPEPWLPTVEYRSTAIVGPPIRVVSNGIECRDGQYTFLSPRGDGMVAHGPTIVDQDGELVWTTTFNDLPTYNLDVNTYRGQDYLTFWAGDDKVDGHGEGFIYMLDSSYSEVYKLKGPHGLSADLHEFQITRNDTALFTVYDVVRADIQSVGGPQRGWIRDGRFVEVDVVTNRVLFEWRASEHINFTEVTQSRDHAGGSYETAWDFFHINGVDKDAKGNFLVTALHADYLIYIDGRTGDVIWRLGGKYSDFKDLSSGDASTFAWPHHARFHDNDTAITLFDNASPKDQRNRGLYLDVDQSAMTVKIRHTYPALEWHMVVPQAQAQSQGSLQVLNSGNILLSYGLNGPAWTEYEGSTPRCHYVFGPEAHFGSGNPASYRVSKHAWKGYPSTTPNFEIFGHEAAVSWNGATEVALWVLEGAEVALPNPNNDPSYYSNSMDEDHIDDDHDEDGDSNDSDLRPTFTLISKTPKSTFETIIQIPPGVESPFLRIRALDASGLVLGTTATLPFDPSALPPTDSNDPNPSPNSPHHAHDDKESTSSFSLFLAGVAATLFLLVLLVLFRRCCIGFCLRRRWQYQYLLKRGRDDDDDDDDDFWESVYGAEEQEVGLHHMSDTDSDDSDEVQVSVLENPRLSPMLVRSPSGLSSFSFGSGLRSPSPGVERVKQQ
ncbi:ASST-domain-containing protein [Aspergillus granulosus]|uniref:ASST-domain-containing protein n=1 Tax=Aspergillus granulosus TaxID=176169 RepID=A0ABR4H6F0_9EURO